MNMAKRGLKNKKVDEKSRKSRRLNKSVIGIASIVGLLLGIVFLSSSITGNVISNLTNTTTSWMGIILIAFGLIGSYVYFRYMLR
jgi:protein-S-isoprenylcysteine O-methyltransferase Ste14